MSNDFYIGWMPSAPETFSRHIRKAVFLLLGFAVIIAGLLSLQQKRFSTASFEFGKLTEVTGIYQQFPVPSIRVMATADAFGNSIYLTIPLTGYGKFGAEGTIAGLEREHGINLANRQVTFRGTLLYSDGKTLLQVDEHDSPLVKWADKASPVSHDTRELGNVQLTGEILDPKCYFGVMKPGHGKPHKDCAIRCIAGGMSPVFYVRNEKGEANYYLLLNENGKKMNEKLKDHIAEPLTLQARAIQYDDWVVLYVKDKTIKPTGGLSWFKSNDATISCRPVRY
jgi:hypothetical protein